MSNVYNPNLIEKKWQAIWKKNHHFKTTTHRKKKFYVLDMFPYPSGKGLHVGHLKGYTATDIIARYKRLKSFDVLHPIGWDAFGLPAEQHALETGIHPSITTKKNIQNFKKQLYSFGFSYDFDKEINTSDPNYYKYTQWIFVKMFEKNLVENKKIDVNWCQGLGTVLANEEIVEDSNGNKVSERGGFPVTKKPMKQWVLKITKYASRLFKDLDLVNWTEGLKKLQKNWIFNQDNTLHLKDWVFSRQRYWGEPIPIAIDEQNNVKVISKLPVKLPYVKKISPSGTGESPLANIKKWLYFTYKNKKYRRETNTMPQWAGSSWYFIAYILKNKDGTFLPLDSSRAKKRLKKWLPVDLYIGGQEHAVSHLLYSRFWFKFLYDLKILEVKEPFQKVINQGIILGPDNHKMSKSKGNIINPDSIVKKYGADSLRLYEMFMGPIEDKNKWTSDAINGTYKWLKRVWNFYIRFIQYTNNEINQKSKADTSLELTKKYNQMIWKVTEHIEKCKFNVAISELMIFMNYIYKLNMKVITKKIMTSFAIILSVFSPHIAEELLEMLNEKPLYYQKWPTFNKEMITEDEVTIAIQINGKLRATLNTEKNTSKQLLIKKAQDIQNIKEHLKKSKILKTIYVENKIINFVVEKK